VAAVKWIVGALAVCLLLSGCGVTEWSGEARFEVTSVTADVAVGDKLVCGIRQRDESKFDDAAAVSHFAPCRRA
jgi:hypothetical protein